MFACAKDFKYSLKLSCKLALADCLLRLIKLKVKLNAKLSLSNFIDI